MTLQEELHRSRYSAFDVDLPNRAAARIDELERTLFSLMVDVEAKNNGDYSGNIRLEDSIKVLGKQKWEEDEEDRR